MMRAKNPAFFPSPSFPIYCLLAYISLRVPWADPYLFVFVKYSGSWPDLMHFARLLVIYLQMVI
jgi:hypothetical protein